MKVVLFCGGQGLRIRDLSGNDPKPMVPIGGTPMLMHIMRYYAHFGHKEFILCLGHRGQAIKEYFLNYQEELLHDFVLTAGGTVQLARREMDDWSITFVDTGLRSNIGQRLMAVEPYLRNDEMFLANYADGLSDVPVPELVENLRRQNKVASFLAVKPSYSFHLVSFTADERIAGVVPFSETESWINGGFFVFRRAIFEYMRPGEELVEEPFQRLIRDDQLVAFRHRGFWASMDTLKDHQNLEALHESGSPPWAVWQADTAQDRLDPSTAPLQPELPRQQAPVLLGR